MSGGLDSSVIAGLCRRAFGRNCLGVIMPCCSAEIDRQHGQAVAEVFDLPYTVVQLDETYRTLLTALQLDPSACSTVDLPLANIKPRLRMTVLYYIAAARHYRVVGTGNKSEIYIGYFTKHGDGAVDLEPLGALTKGEVKKLGEYLGVPPEILQKKPTAGLWEGQTDEGEMGFSYEELDRFLQGGPVVEETREKIEKLHAQNKHKVLPPPIFQKKA